MSRRLPVDHQVVTVAVVFALLSGIALALGTPVSRVTEVAIYALYALGVNFLIGYAGLVPFGASFFFGVAGYAVALSMKGALPGEVPSLLLGLVFSVVLALVLGSIILRRRGLYFSLLTLACSQIAFELAYNLTAVTGGENGIQDVPRPTFASPMAFHLFTVAVVIALVWVLRRLAHAPFGRVLQALRDNEQRVQSLGFDTFAIKLLAFCVSGGLIGVSGGLMALLLRGAYANNLSWQHAGDAVLMSALGGVHHFLGPLWGAITFIVLEDRLSAVTENWWLFFAPIIILFAVLSPEGMHGAFRRWRRRDGRWTLIREGIPDRPARIEPYVPGDPSRAAPGAGRPVLSVRGLSKRFGSIVTADQITLDVHHGRLHSLIGPNGAGKTTFFNMLTGVLTPDAGTIELEGRDVTRMPVHRRARLGLARSFQILSVFPNLTTFENVRIAVQGAAAPRGGFWRDAHRNQRDAGRVWSMLDAVGLVERAGEVSAALSHGERRLLEIAVALASDARVLLLDEPLAGLGQADRDVVCKLITRLASSHAVLLVEHDIDRVLTLSDRITVLHQGRLIADGAPRDVAVDPGVTAAYMGEPQARPGEGVEVSAVQAPARAGRPGQQEVGAPLLALEQVKAGYGGGTVLEGVDLTIGANEVVALLGRNGVGKTTLLRAVMGVVPVQSGRIVLNGREVTNSSAAEINRLGIAVVPEGRRLFPNLTVMENLRIAARPGGASEEEIFDLFPRLAQRARSRAETLSGGERQMVALARALMAPSQLILLDEPFEGLAPTVVQDVRRAVQQISTRTSTLIVEHQADSVLEMAHRAYVLVNGRMAFSGAAQELARDGALQQRLLATSAGHLGAQGRLPGE